MFLILYLLFEDVTHVHNTSFRSSHLLFSQIMPCPFGVLLRDTHIHLFETIVLFKLDELSLGRGIFVP